MSTTRQRQSSPVEVLEHRACLLPWPRRRSGRRRGCAPCRTSRSSPSLASRAARGERLVGRRAGPSSSGAEQLVVLVRVADRVELEDAGVGGAVELREAEPEPFARLGGGRADEDRRRELGQPCGTGPIGVGPRFAEADEVGVRVDHDHAQLGLEQELLEHDAERVRLARAGLSAEERVPVETGGVDPRRHRLVTAREHGADHELGGVALRAATAPRPRSRSRPRPARRRTGRRRRRARRRFPRRRAPARAPGVQRPVAGEALAVERGADLGPVARHELLRDHLAEPAHVAVDERDEAAGRRHGAPDRELVAERASVHRDRRRGDRLLEPAPQVAEAPDRAAELVRG